MADPAKNFPSKIYKRKRMNYENENENGKSLTLWDTEIFPPTGIQTSDASKHLGLVIRARSMGPVCEEASMCSWRTD